MLTSRQAEARLLDELGITRRRARRVLACGLAGDPQRTTASLLYDEAQLDALIERPSVSAAVLHRHSASGLFIARRDVDVRLPETDRLARLSGGWRVSLPTVIWIRWQAERHGSMPLVATVGGFVASVADIMDAVGDVGSTDPAQPVAGRAMPRTRLELRAPGAWFADFADRRLMTGPGQPALVLGGPTGGGVTMAAAVRPRTKT